MRLRIGPREAPPDVFQLFCGGDWLGLSRSQTTALWHALRLSTRPAAVWMRSTILGFGVVHPARRAQLDRLARETLRADKCVLILEDLVDEGLLTRGDATAIEEQILNHVTRDGRWR